MVLRDRLSRSNSYVSPAAFVPQGAEIDILRLHRSATAPKPGPADSAEAGLSLRHKMVSTMVPVAAPLISFQNVSKTYPNGTDALRDISLEVPRQDFVFLVGPSGAGKSTLVRLLIREERATAGKIFVDGVELGRLKRRHLPRLRRKIGIVFQDYKLLPNLSVFQNVAFAVRVTDGALRHLRPKVEEVLSIVGLEGKDKKFPDELSGGEQQRVAIARALVHDPTIFLADEPTGNLDPATSWEILQLLLQINARGTTVLMATHNREIVDVMRRRVIAIEGGRIVRDEDAGGYHAAANLESR
jgi:cell division transport system ATP-binding protein